MGIFTKTKEKDELVLVFDIGSSSVGGALFRMQESGIPKIIFTMREPIILEKQFETDRFLSQTTKSLNIVVRKIYEMGLGAPSRIFCVLSSPWYFSQTRVVHFEKNTPFIFTSKLAESLVQKELNLFKEEYLAQEENKNDGARLIELKNIKIMLNGYETAEPLDQRAKKLEMTIFISMSGEQILNKIVETIADHFHFKEINFTSFAMTSFSTVRDLYAHNESFLLIDIGGEVTDISLIKKNTLSESISYPIGSNFIIRGVASSLHSSLHEAKSFTSLLRDGHASEATEKKLELILDKLKTDWLQKFQESLANLSHDISIPATIYLTVDKDLADLFCKTIENEQFNQYTLTESKFHIILLSAEIFQKKAIFETGVMRDPSLIVDSIYINRFLK